MTEAAIARNVFNVTQNAVELKEQFTPKFTYFLDRFGFNIDLHASGFNLTFCVNLLKVKLFCLNLCE